MLSDDTIQQLLDCLYDAALSPSRWPHFLSTLAATFNATLPTLFLHDVRGNGGALTACVGYEDRLVRDYQEHFAARNLWLRSGAHLLTAGRVRTSHMMCSRSLLLRSEWYADFCRPLAISQGIGATILGNGTATSNIAIFAGDERADFGAAEVAGFYALMPHLQRAQRIRLQLEQACLQRGELAEALEHLRVGVLLLSADSTVLYLNHAARQILGRRDGLLIDGARLRAVRRECNDLMAARIAAAARTSARSGFSAGGTLLIARSTGAPLEVQVAPIARSMLSCAPSAATAAVYLTEPRAPVDPQAVAALYGLTPAESRVARYIARGLSSRQVARTLKVSPHTVKTQLNHIFAKTGTRRQGELIRLMVSGVGPAAHEQDP